MQSESMQFKLCPQLVAIQDQLKSVIAHHQVLFRRYQKEPENTSLRDKLDEMVLRITNLSKHQKVLVGQFMVGNVQRSKAVTSCMVSEEAGCQDETTLPQSTSPLAAHGSVAILASLATQAKAGHTSPVACPLSTDAGNNPACRVSSPPGSRLTAASSVQQTPVIETWSSTSGVSPVNTTTSVVQFRQVPVVTIVTVTSPPLSLFNSSDSSSFVDIGGSRPQGSIITSGSVCSTAVRETRPIGRPQLTPSPSCASPHIRVPLYHLNNHRHQQNRHRVTVVTDNDAKGTKENVNIRHHHRHHNVMNPGARSGAELEGRQPLRQVVPFLPASVSPRYMSRLSEGAPLLSTTDKEKVQFMGAVGLVTRDLMRELSTRRHERKRRSTANPLYCYAFDLIERRRNNGNSDACSSRALTSCRRVKGRNKKSSPESEIANGTSDHKGESAAAIDQQATPHDVTSPSSPGVTRPLANGYMSETGEAEQRALWRKSSELLAERRLLNERQEMLTRQIEDRRQQCERVRASTDEKSALTDTLVQLVKSYQSQNPLLASVRS